MPVLLSDVEGRRRAATGTRSAGSCLRRSLRCWEGRCRLETCNFGYGRGICDAFPADSVSDAVRFTRLGDRTIYILEREYLPVRHGDVDTLTGTLARQAEVFCEWAAR